MWLSLPTFRTNAISPEIGSAGEAEGGNSLFEIMLSARNAITKKATMPPAIRGRRRFFGAGGGGGVKEEFGSGSDIGGGVGSGVLGGITFESVCRSRHVCAISPHGDYHVLLSEFPNNLLPDLRLIERATKGLHAINLHRPIVAVAVDLADVAAAEGLEVRIIDEE